MLQFSLLKVIQDFEKYNFFVPTFKENNIYACCGFLFSQFSAIETIVLSKNILCPI